MPSKKIFSPFFRKMIPLKNFLDEKLFKFSFSIKKVRYILFCRQAPFPSKEAWPSETVFRRFFGKYNFFEKTVKQ